MVYDRVQLDVYKCDTRLEMKPCLSEEIFTFVEI